MEPLYFGEKINIYVNDVEKVCGGTVVGSHNNGQNFLIAFTKLDARLARLGGYRELCDLPNQNNMPEAYNFNDKYDELKSYQSFVWIGDAYPTTKYERTDDRYGDGPIVSSNIELFSFIKGSEILPGDTICFCNDKHILNFGYVLSISDDEEEYFDWPSRIAQIKLFCEKGERSFPNGYPIMIEQNYLLIKRENKK